MAVKDTVQISTAIISVHDKTGIKYFASELARLNPDVKIISSGGTYKEIEKVAAGNVVDVSSYTGFPELPGGLVKTLHPKLHGGILGGDEQEQDSFMKSHGIEKIDLVVVNLYPFKKVSSEKNVPVEIARANMDVGGVSLIEAGCKNFLRVAVVTEPTDYEKILEHLRAHNTRTDLALRLSLAKRGVAHISSYLAAISQYFSGLSPDIIKKEYKTGNLENGSKGL